MVLRDLIGDVLRTLWSHKLRTFLTMFGIAWGIVSIVLMVAAGEGLRKGQEDQARTLGKDVMIVFTVAPACKLEGRGPGEPCTGKIATWLRSRLTRRIANTPFRNWSRTTSAPTATSTMPRSWSLVRCRRFRRFVASR